METHRGFFFREKGAREPSVPSKKMKKPALLGFLLFFLSIVLVGVYDQRLGFFFLESNVFFDEGHYRLLAEKGYFVASEAFHPLYPLLVRGLIFLTGMKPLLLGRLLSLFFFGATLPILHRFLLKLVKPSVAAWGVLLFALNPFSVFHVLAYTESLFGFVAVSMLLLACGYLRQGGFRKLIIVSFLAFLLGLTRPSVYPFFCIAIIGAGFFLAKIRHDFQKYRRVMILFAFIFGSAVISTTLFFLYLAVVKGNFWASIDAQKAWGREFGLHWNLIFHPKSLNGSDNLLIWEIQAFWGPVVLVVAMLPLLWRKHREISGFKNRFLEKAFVFWFSVLYAGFHTAIQFFTHDRFYSLGRHVFALPFFFIALSILLDEMPERPLLRRSLAFYLFASFVYLGIYWARIPNGAWIG